MRKGRRSLLGLFLLGAVGRATGAGSRVRPPLARLDSELADIATDPGCELASLSVLAIRAGQVAYERQFGKRIIGPPSAPANARTMYRIASISKMITTFAAMKLVEEGELSLDTDVSSYLGFPLRNPHCPERVITLRALLTHTSSLRDDAAYSWDCTTALKDILLPGARLYGQGEMWAKNAPAGFFSYSNLNWGVIGTIMEKVSGERFDRLMKRLILDPMGLHGGFNPSEFSAEDLSNLATLYRKRTTDTEIWDARGPWIAQADDYSERPPAAPPGIASYVVGTNATPFSPTGGLRISAADMGQIMLMLINKGRHEGRQILQPATLDRMFSRQWTYDGKGGNGDSNRGLFNAWGMGNQHFPDQPGSGRQVVDGGGFSGVGHLGEAYGLMSAFIVDPARKDGMVVLVGGTSTDPEARRGTYSSLARFQERILSAVYQRAILGKGA